MPSVTLHLHLAELVLSGWRRAGADAPFPAEDPRCANAFRQGALGPDLGYVPGGERRLSDLAHCLGSADLARTLLAGARTPRERAFAWGWLTHVLGDREIHPLIAEGVGALRSGRRSPVAAWRDPVGHVRVETGVDVHFAARFPELGETPLEPVFDAASVVYLTEAYRRTYGLDPGGRRVLRSHRTATRMSRWGLRILAAMGRGGGGSPRGPGSARLVRPIRRALWRLPTLTGPFLRRDSLPHAFLRPFPPPSWLLDEIQRVLERFPSLFHHHVRTRLVLLDNVNLDTGRPEEDRPRHPVTARLRNELGSGAGAALPPPGLAS